MAELKDKVVTLESLKALHENNKRKYMPMVNPVGSGKMTIDGDISVSGSITLGDTVRLMPTTDGFDIMFLDTDTAEEESIAEEVNGGEE